MLNVHGRVFFLIVMLDEKSMDLMKKLMEGFGPSGFEREVNRMCKEYMTPITDEILTDKLGSVTLDIDGPKFLMSGHTDEVGFIISSVTKEGFMTFNPLGGWFDQVLLAQRVMIRGSKGLVPGVIASKPPHILPTDQRNKVVTKNNMFIDIGATSKEEVEEAGIQIGDPAVPWSPFSTVMGGRIAMGKAFDDRIGAFIAMEVIRRLKEQNIPHPNMVYGACTVQEEVGVRGAGTTAYVVDPDVAIAIEVDIAGDVPGIKPQEAPAKMGKGPSLLAWDRSMIPNQPFKRMVLETAKQAQIPLQLSMVSGGTDAGKFHQHKTGCPSVVISVPTRHIHSHVGYLSLKDVENAIRLIIEVIKKLDKETVESFTAL